MQTSSPILIIFNEIQDVYKHAETIGTLLGPFWESLSWYRKSRKTATTFQNIIIMDLAFLYVD